MRAGINGEGTFLSPANIKAEGWKTPAPVIALSTVTSAKVEAKARETDKALKGILEKIGVGS